MEIQPEKIIEPGSFVLVCGKTGSGKTTFLKKLKKTLGGRAGMVMQNPDNQIVTDTVYAELSFGLACEELPENTVRRRVAETASYFGLSRMSGQKTAMLSGGEKQLLNIASVMAMNPDTLILDEPVSMLDPVMTDRIFERIIKINKEHLKTVVIAEHRPEELFAFADTVIVMDGGNPVFYGKPQETAEYMIENGFEKLLPVTARLFKNVRPVPLSLKEGRKYIEEMNIKPDKNPESSGNGKLYDGLCAALSMKDVYFSYEKHGRAILDGFSMKLYGGKVHVLMGENGSGKTTVSRIINGTLKAYSGHIKREKCKIAALSQDITDHFIKDSYNGVHPYELSSGEQQKLAISLILQDDPDMIILDEPAKGLDGGEKNDLINTINELKEKGKTLLIITHDTEFAAETADIIYMISDGRTVFCGSPEDFIREGIFYTTSVRRMWKGISDSVITEKDAGEWIG